MEIVTESRFRKDIKRLKKRGKDFSKLEKILHKIMRGEELEDKYKNHPLVGDWRPCWDLHIEPDWLLIYYIDNDKLVLVRTGTHADLF